MARGTEVEQNAERMNKVAPAGMDTEGKERSMAEKGKVIGSPNRP